MWRKLLDSVQTTTWESIDVGTHFVELKLSLPTKYSWKFDGLMDSNTQKKKKINTIHKKNEFSCEELQQSLFLTLVILERFTEFS